ncbi:methyltransferase family protein [Paraburkholderia bengalensis]|uniref:methyltransferase family protein n=1 Tax=Paraburkholderia bengalensis TaxID=2747562 RepID=UPI0030158687
MSTIVDEASSSGAQSLGCSAPIVPPALPRTVDVLYEVTARACAAVVMGIFSYAAFLHWLADPGRATLLLLVLTQCFTVGLSLFSRVPLRRDWTPFAYICSIGATYYFLAVQLGPGVQIVPEAVGAAFQVAGMCWQLFAKASLRRSFGILPANRGVVSTGAYRFVRHPMYLGYLVEDVGFLLSNFGGQNLLVFGIQFALQACRITREERLLSDDALYRAYTSNVRYRVLPGLY